MENKPCVITAKELAAAGKDQTPDFLVSNRHLIYSAPATLSFNSPGAEGFGVKRAGLAIPGSVMLLVAPGCCGRNTSSLGTLGKDIDRFFYYMMDETDIVTGRHLSQIPEAVKEVYESLEEKPSVVMICITCVDALLGTDMERVCKNASERTGCPVLPCYMYALTREGRKPPMVHVRQSLYSLLEPMPKVSTTVNLLGYFSPLRENCELYEILRQLGIQKINELSRCADYEEYQQMAQANFNLVLNPEAGYAAQDLQKRLNMPFIELLRLYQIEKIHRQYVSLGAALGSSIDDQVYYNQAKQTVEAFINKYGALRVSIGGTMNANAYELAAALLEYGLQVEEIYANYAMEDYFYVKKIAASSPETKIYSNLEPTMLYYDCSESQVDITLGRDAVYYHPDCPNVPWNTDRQPFGYQGLIELFQEMDLALQRRTI